MRSPHSELPRGWIEGALADFVQPRGEKVTPSSMPDATFLGMDHVEAHTMRIIGGVPASKMKSAAARFYKGDVLYGRLRPYLNKVAAPSFDGLASAEFIVFPDNAVIRSQFLQFRLNAADFVSFAAHLNEGDRPRVDFDQIGAFRVLLPPPAEQVRIIGKVEELFSELDKGDESLTTAHQQLKAYRQSLLSFAFQGKLTHRWREERGPLPSAESIRDGLAAARESQSAALKKARRSRKVTPVNELSAEVLEGLPDIPAEWVWDKLGWMTCGVEYGTAAKSSKDGRVPVVRMGNIQNGVLDWSDLVFTDDAQEIEQYTLRDGDVLFNRTNSPELVGKTAIYRGERPAVFAGYLIRINHNTDIVDGDYLNLFLNSHLAKTYGNSVKTDGVNQSNINGEKLQSYPFPYCSLAEQREIVRILQEKLSHCDNLLAEIEAQQTRIYVLRQAIFRKAFSGQLVAQDDCDTPASDFLERICAEQQKGSAKKRRANKNNKKEAA